MKASSLLLWRGKSAGPILTLSREEKRKGKRLLRVGKKGGKGDRGSSFKFCRAESGKSIDEQKIAYERAGRENRREKRGKKRRCAKS